MPQYKVIVSPVGSLQFVPTITALAFKAAVATHSDLPLSGNNLNDARLTESDGYLWAWTKDAPTGLLTDWTSQGDFITLNWSDIINKPSSSVADIDDAVTKKHISGSELQLARPQEVHYNPIYPLNDPLVSAQRTILYFPTGFNVGGLGTFYKYVMVWANDNFNVLKVSGSNDFKTWIYIADCVGVIPGSHPSIVDIGGGQFRLYYLNATFTYTFADLRTAVSIDLLNFTSEQPLQKDLVAPIITEAGVGWNRASYGFGSVIFNPSATNIGSNPFDYSYVGYYDVTDGGFESIALGYSADGILYKLYGTVPVLDHSTSIWGDNLIWDSSYATAPQVVKINSKYLMFYAGGITSVLEGIGSAISDDGLVWKKISVNHSTICPQWGKWNHTSCSFPSVVVDLVTRFAGAGELADLKMIVTGGVAADWTYANGVYVIPNFLVPVEESIYHIESYCLPEQKASAITNDSTVSGTTVKNALETLSSALAVPVTNTLYVDGNRSDDYTANGSITKPFKKIQDAIDAIVSPSATNKHVIEIAPGAYYTDAITINKVHTTFRSCGIQGARISGKITITNPLSPTPHQITFVGLRISGGLECLASHTAINCIDCNVTGFDWVFNPTTPTDDEYLQVWGGLYNVTTTLTNVYTYLMGGGYYCTFTATNGEFNINNADINDPFQVTLNGTVIASAYGDRTGNSKFILNSGATLNIDADTEGGSVVTVNSGATLNRTTKAANIKNVPAGNIASTDVQAALNELDSEKTTLSAVKLDTDIADAIEDAHEPGSDNQTADTVPTSESGISVQDELNLIDDLEFKKHDPATAGDGISIGVSGAPQEIINTDKGTTAVNAHKDLTTGVHGVGSGDTIAKFSDITKVNVGLPDVDNVSEATIITDVKADTEIAAALVNIILNIFLTVKHIGTTFQKIVNGIVDAFKDENGIDLINSLGFVYDGVNYLISTQTPVLDANTKMLLHCNGEDGSTTFTDECGNIMTANFDAKIKQDQKKFGTASGYYDGTDDSVTTPATSDFAFGTGDFTIDFWLRHKTVDTWYYHYFDLMEGRTTGIEIRWSGFTNTLLMRIGGTYYSSAPWTPVANTWYHMAVVRTSGKIKIFINGTQLGTDISDSYSISVASGDIVKIGNSILDTTLGMYGWIDEFRVSNIARWTTDFSVPTSEYGAISDNMLILSNQFLAEAVPTKGKLVIFEEDIDAITLNTDLKGYISNDDGSNWIETTLTDKGDYATGKRILESNLVTLTPGVSNDKIKYKITTNNLKRLNIHGVSVNWQ